MRRTIKKKSIPSDPTIEIYVQGEGSPRINIFFFKFGFNFYDTVKKRL